MASVSMFRTTNSAWHSRISDRPAPDGRFAPAATITSIRPATAVEDPAILIPLYEAQVCEFHARAALLGEIVSNFQSRYDEIAVIARDVLAQGATRSARAWISAAENARTSADEARAELRDHSRVAPYIAHIEARLAELRAAPTT